FQAEDGIRDFHVTGVQTCALPIFDRALGRLEEEGGRVLAEAWMRRAIWYRGPLCVPHEVLAAARRALEVFDADVIEDEGLRQERSEERRVGKEGRRWWGREYDQER